MAKVELIYVTSDKVTIHLAMNLNSGATVSDALIASRIHDTHPETKNLPVGIYAKQVALDQILKDGDRIEIYRTLLLDPKEKRRLKAHVAH